MQGPALWDNKELAEDMERDDAQLFTMPSGESVWYYDDGHNYCAKSPSEHKSGKCYNACPSRVSGVSTVAKNDGTDSEGLTRWYESLACHGVAELAAKGLAGQTVQSIVTQLSWLQDGKSVLSAIQAAHLTGADEMHRRSGIGNAAHKVLEYIVENDAKPPFSGGHQMAVIDWWEKTRPTPVASERVVYDHEHGFAGRFDLQYGTDSTTLLDLKTGRVRESVMIQLNLYRIGCRVAGFRVPDRLAVLDTKDDGSWREIEIPVNASWALDALSVHRNGKEMGRTLRQALKTARRS